MSDCRSDDSFRRGIPDFTRFGRGLRPVECQLPVLLFIFIYYPKNRNLIGRKYAQKEGDIRLANEHIRNHMVPISTSGFIAENWLKPEVDKNGRKYAKTKGNS